MSRLRVATPDELERAIRAHGPHAARRALSRYGLLPPIGGMAPIAVDTSTPAINSNSTTGSAITTFASNSFSPPAGSLIVACFMNSLNGNQATSMTDSLGTHLAWTQAVTVARSSNDAATIWTAPCPSAQAGMTVTAGFSSLTPGFAKQIVVAVVVLTGAGRVGATATNTSATNTIAPTVTISSLQGSNSLVMGAVAEGTGGGNPTFPGGQSDVFGSQTLNASGTTSNWCQYLTGINLAAGSGATVNATAPVGDWSIVAAEILAAATPFAPTIFIP